jgi:preprotein translocase subunit SecA
VGAVAAAGLAAEIQDLAMHVTQASMTQTWRALANDASPRRPERGLEKVWLAAEGLVACGKHRTGVYLQIAAEVARRKAAAVGLTDGELRERATQLRRQWIAPKPARDVAIDSLAALRELARREIGLEAFPVQIAGVAAMLEGCVLEMGTGEGKTLVAGIGAVLKGWRGRGCHVVTVNDYLVQRDAEWMAPLYRACGVEVGFIRETSNALERRRAYQAEITYATNKELAADFLRDRITLQRWGDPARFVLDSIRGHAPSGPGLLMRGLECAIVDEADAILIDEAVTPLIISAPAAHPEAEQSALRASEVARALTEPIHYRLDRRFREVRLTDEGRRAIAAATAGHGGVWQSRRRAQELVISAVQAQEFYQRDRHYIVDDGRAVIVDEFTGRLMPDRTWRDGLHQAIEAKEGIAIRPLNETVARISFQRFFRSYKFLAGMTGTARECRGELWSTYRVPTVWIPPNRPCLRRHLPARVCRDAPTRTQALVEHVAAIHAQGTPVLIGTRTIDASERLSAQLSERGIAHSVLNAVRSHAEAEVIRSAGQLGSVTIATNMAGRGTDVRLEKGVPEVGGLHVVLSEPNESGRIDRQFFGRAARQGSPGSCVLYVSMDDEVIRRLGKPICEVLRWTGSPPWLGRAAKLVAQSLADRVARRRRAAVVRSDTWLEKGLGFAPRWRS